MPMAELLREVLEQAVQGKKPDDFETTAGYLHAVAADKVAVIDALNGQLAGNVAKSSSLTN